MSRQVCFIIVLATSIGGCAGRTVQPALESPAAAPNAVTSAAAPSVTPPSGYVIGSEDLLDVVFWGEKEMSAEVLVRPDGHVSLPLLNDVPAAGLTPEQLRLAVIERAKSFVEEPHATVLVKAINSRKVYITGNVERPGPYPLTNTMTVLQLIAVAGGVKEYADAERIVILRQENGKTSSLDFNYHDVVREHRFAENVQLSPGDTVVVP